MEFYGRIYFPKSKAERTVSWFLYGRNPGSFPVRYNCRCAYSPVVGE